MTKQTKTPVDLLIHSANQLLTMAGGPQRGSSLGQLNMLENGAIALRGDQIVEVGQSADLLSRFESNRMVDASGRVVLPGFVDPHTHVVWAGDRAAEFEMRLAGASYMEIMASGGGIASTVRQTRQASLEQLKTETRPRLRRMLEHGTTTAEVKSGYGLDESTEQKQLQAIVELDQEGPLQLLPTYLGAHALPPDRLEDPEQGYQQYTKEILESMLPGLLRWWQSHFPERPLPFVDVFCEEGAFNLDQSRQILIKAIELGFPVKIHADEFEGLGGTRLAVSIEAASADHLVCTPPEGIAALGASDTVAVSLPATPFGLGKHQYTPAQALLEAGAILALASDLNPGTAWCESMQMVIAIACRSMGLTPAQAIAAATINAAAALNLEDQIGSLEQGKQADLIMLDAPDYRHLGYRFGGNLVAMTVKRSQVVYTAVNFSEV
jgi:imidazolonepropionase